VEDEQEVDSSVGGAEGAEDKSVAAAPGSGSARRRRKSTRDWSADWSECTGCKRACGATAAQICTIDTLDLTDPANFDPADFAKNYRGRRPLLLRNASRNLAPQLGMRVQEGVDGDGGQPDFSRPTLLERYGDIQVQLSSPISQVDGRGAAVAGEQAA